MNGEMRKSQIEVGVPTKNQNLSKNGPKIRTLLDFFISTLLNVKSKFRQFGISSDLLEDVYTCHFEGAEYQALFKHFTTTCKWQ